MQYLHQRLTAHTQSCPHTCNTASTQRAVLHSAHLMLLLLLPLAAEVAACAPSSANAACSKKQANAAAHAPAAAGVQSTPSLLLAEVQVNQHCRKYQQQRQHHVKCLGGTTRLGSCCTCISAGGRGVTALRATAKAQQETEEERLS